MDIQDILLGSRLVTFQWMLQYTLAEITTWSEVGHTSMYLEADPVIEIIFGFLRNQLYLPFHTTATPAAHEPMSLQAFPIDSLA